MVISLLPTELSEEIRRLHTDGRPLNITAVKRHSPDLLRAIYTIPRLTWKDALEAAGLDYQKIQIELMPTCACLLCGKEAENLGRHLQSAHGLTTVRYREQFRGAEVAAERVKAKVGMRADAPLPHSEPIWSAEYCLDRLREYDRHGLRMTFWWVSKQEKGFTAAAIQYFGSWAEALRQAGFDPNEDRFTVKRTAWSQRTILEILRERQRQGQPVNFGAVVAEDYTLTQAITRHFGSHANALRRAGIDPLQVRKRPFRYTPHDKRLFMAEVRRVAELKGVERYYAVEKLHKEFGTLVANNFRSWKKAAALARIEPKYLFRRRFPDAETVLDWMAKWVTEGGELKASRIIEKDVGLYKAIVRFFGTFDNMLQVMRSKPQWVKKQFAVPVI
jgi:hypothetical protein